MIVRLDLQRSLELVADELKEPVGLLPGLGLGLVVEGEAPCIQGLMIVRLDLQRSLVLVAGKLGESGGLSMAVPSYVRFFK
jgi:hypothetical protein